MASQKELLERIARLEAVIEQVTGRPAEREPEDPRERADYVERGSNQHAALLGLVEDGDAEQQVGGWALADPTLWLMLDPKGDLAMHVLRQKVAELNTPMPEVQSHDPRAAHYAPPMFVPANFQA